MTACARYVGRLGGDGIDDSLSGPETIQLAFSGDVLIIEDPLSFPWGLASDDDWFTGVAVDLRHCSEESLIALYEVLPLLTPSDKLVLRDDQRDEVLGRLRLPDSVALAEIPTDIDALRNADKASQVLLREGVGRAIVEGLRNVDTDGCVVDCAPPHRWLSAMIPRGHQYASTLELEQVDERSADVLIQWGASSDAALLRRAQRSLRADGLLVFVLDAADVSSASSEANVRDLLSTIDDTFGQHHVVELVWGLRGRPGTPPGGAVIAIRPLRAVG